MADILFDWFGFEQTSEADANSTLQKQWGAWVVSHSDMNIGTLHHALSLGDSKLFFGPKHNINTFFMILFGLFDLILLFVCQICRVNCEKENWK